MFSHKHPSIEEDMVDCKSSGPEYLNFTDADYILVTMHQNNNKFQIPILILHKHALALTKTYVSKYGLSCTVPKSIQQPCKNI